ncbi:hypothetical protein IAU60_002904 [Kwoniella sp. DSM 27419]
MLRVHLPAPRRGLRSLLVLLAVVLGPYVLLRQMGQRLFPADRTWTDMTKRPWTRTAGVSAGDGGATDGSYVHPHARARSTKAKGLHRHPQHHKLGQGKEHHTYLPSGLLIPNPAGSHPVLDLIESSKHAWEDKLSGQSTTLGQAVDEYRRRYERDPPRGFERWWDYVEKHGVALRDEYDQIHRDLAPFHALTPAELRFLVEEASAKSGMYTISCPGITHTKKSKVKPGSNKSKLQWPSSGCSYEIQQTGLNEEGKRVASERAREQLGLLEDIEDLLEEVKVVMYSHDVPWQFVGHEYKSALEDAASVGEFYNTHEHQIDTAHLGWASACAPHKPLRETYDPDVLPDVEGLWSGHKSFVWDHKATMDPCVHPDLTHLVGFLSGHGKGPGPSKELFPVLAMCKTTLHADVLGVSMEAWTEDVGEDPSWEDKRDERLLWRGKTTGIYYKDDVPWNISQRINLVHRGAQKDGYLPVLDPSTAQPVDKPLGRLNDEMMDVAFVDEAIQCDEHVCRTIEKDYKFGERKNWDQGNQYKYLIDIDGNGWSARFKRLMSTNSAILKSTIFPEWYTDRIQPWVHYIPIKADLTDVYDVLSFFRAEGNDYLAKEIATAGKRWSKTFWRKEDMIAYQFRLFLEYARLTAPDRQQAAFRLRGEELR